MVLGIIVYRVYPFVSSFIPRSFVVRSPNLHTTGAYYPLTFNGANKVYIEKGSLVVEGFDVTFLKPVPEGPVSRHLPDKWANAVIPDTSWHMVFGLSKVVGMTNRAFARGRTKDTLVVALPAGNDNPYFSAYRTPNGDTILIALASGNFEAGENVYLGYVAAWKN